MTSQHSFSIRTDFSFPNAEKCPVCGDDFTTSGMDVYDSNDVPLCHPCAWEKAPELASLLSLGVAAYYNVKGGMPDDVFHVLEKRRADPERLKRKLKEAYESLHDTGRGPLAELVAGQVKAALDSGTVATMITAKALVEETRNRVPNLDTEIPF